MKFGFNVSDSDNIFELYIYKKRNNGKDESVLHLLRVSSYE